MPELGAGDRLWVRVTNDGTNVTVKCLKDNSDAPTEGEWDSADPACTISSSSFDADGGGGLGFVCGYLYLDNITVDSWDGDSWETEFREDFTVDASGYAAETPVHDATGNLTYDGLYAYTYDAWNRLVKVTRAYRDSGSDLTLGSQIAALTYDPAGRRIGKEVTHSADWNATYAFYYDGWSMIETRNASGQVLTQQVWGAGYIDELVQVAVNDDPADEGEDDCETSYYPMQDANFNVLGLADADGNLVERYEYTPYGQRTVYMPTGANDTLTTAPVLESQRVEVAGARQPYSLCDFGHQGLRSEKEFGGQLDNRTRPYEWLWARFPVRDGGYWDGLNLHTYVRNNPAKWRDPLGQAPIYPWDDNIEPIPPLPSLSQNRFLHTMPGPSAEPTIIDTPSQQPMPPLRIDPLPAAPKIVFPPRQRYLWGSVDRTVKQLAAEYYGEYTWPARYAVVVDRHICSATAVVSIDVHDPRGLVTTQVLGIWGNNIRSQWNGRYRLCCCDSFCLNGYYLSVKPAFSVLHQAYKTLPPEQQGLETADYHVTAFRGGGASLDMWNVISETMAGHEFGHMLGNIDEYGGKFGPGTVGNNIMAWPTMPPKPRHYSLLAMEASRLLDEGQSCSIIPAGAECPR